jgi:membrane-associated protein
MTVSGIFLRLGYFSFWPLYVVLMLGDLAADIIWYAVGYYGGHRLVHRYGKYFSISDALLAKTEAAFHRHQNKILFISKITMGLGFALVILITAGVMRIPFKKYVLFNVLGQTIWTALLIGVGYFFGGVVVLVNESLRLAAGIAFALVVTALLYGVNRYLRSRDIKNRL